MSTIEPLVSIVVPTKNRYFYLKKLVESVSDFAKDGKVEFIIQDNSDSNDEILSFLNVTPYTFVRYFYNNQSMPISDNSDLAINNSSGKYVTFIGDDDGITHYILDCCEWMEANEIECVVPQGYSYKWPDAISSAVDDSGSLDYIIPSNKIRIESTENALQQLVASGCCVRSYVPLLYHGIVKRKTLDKIWHKCGTYFPGASPDMANGVALCLVMNKFAFVDFPVVFSGASKHLGGGAKGMRHRAEADFKKLPFLPDNIDQIWNIRIPKIWTGPTIWCESAIEAFMAMGKTDYMQMINFENLYATFISQHFYYRGMAYQLSSDRLGLFIKSSAKIIKRYFNAFIRLVNKIVFKNKIYRSKRKEINLIDIIQCIDFLYDVINKNRINPFV